MFLLFDIPDQSNRGPLKKKEEEKKCGRLLTGRLRRGPSEKSESSICLGLKGLLCLTSTLVALSCFELS